MNWRDRGGDGWGMVGMVVVVMVVVVVFLVVVTLLFLCNPATRNTHIDRTKEAKKITLVAPSTTNTATTSPMTIINDNHDRPTTKF